MASRAAIVDGSYPAAARSARGADILGNDDLPRGGRTVMVPARLARAWAWHLPGGAMLTVERVAAALVPDAPKAADAGDRGPAGLVEGVQRRGAGVRDALARARIALAAGDCEQAARQLVAARELAAALADPLLDTWIDLFASMIAAGDGSLDLGAALSLRAEHAAIRAGEAPSFLAVWWTRAARALRRGHGPDGTVMARWMRPWLDQVAPPLAGWLRCFEGAVHLDEERANLAISTAAPVLAVAPTTPAGWAAGRLVTRAFLALGRADDAARIAAASLDHAARAPDPVRALCYVDAAVALAAADLGDDAERCARIAEELDPAAAADPTAAEIDSPGIELILL